MLPPPLHFCSDSIIQSVMMKDTKDHQMQCTQKKKPAVEFNEK
jgi:hypothetical protein